MKRISRVSWPAISLTLVAVFISIISSLAVGVGIHYAAVVPAFLGGAVIYYAYLTSKPENAKTIFHACALITIILCAIWPRYAALFLPGLPLINPQRIANITLLATLFVALFSSSYIIDLLKSSFRQHRTFWLIFIFFCAIRLISSVLSSDPVTSIYRLSQEFFVHTVFIIAGLHFGSTQELRRRLAIVFSICLFIACAAAIAEFTLKRNIFSYFITPRNEYMAWALSDQFRDGKFRAKGTFDHPLTMAEFVSIAAAIGSALLFSSKRKIARYILLPLLAAAAVTSVLLSGSRSGYAAMAIVISLLIIIPPILSIIRGSITLGQTAFWSIASIFLGAILVAGFITVFEHTIGKHAYTESDAMRAEMFENTLVLLKESPLWGHGVGLAPEKIGVLTERTRVYTVDSFLMSVTVESGILALFSLLFMLVYAFKEGILQSLKSNSSDWQLWIGFSIAALVCLTFKTILSLLDNNHLMYLLMGVLVASQLKRESYHEK